MTKAKSLFAADRTGNGTPPIPPISYGGVVEMTVDEWAVVPPNPRQRNTQAHARKNKKLHTLDPLHASVNAARLPDGRLIKLDGHTRDFLWNTRQVIGPTVIFVTVWNCRNVTASYLRFDSPDAVENITDLLYGLCHEFDIKFESDFLLEFHFASGLAMAQQFYYGHQSYTRDKVIEVLQDWTPELLLLDGCSPTREWFISPVIAGALLIMRSDGIEAQRFLMGVQQNAGTKGDGKIDAVQALVEFIVHVKDKRQIWGNAARGNIIRTVVATFQAYKEDRSYTVSARHRLARPMTDRVFRIWLENTKLKRS